MAGYRSKVTCPPGCSHAQQVRNTRAATTWSCQPRAVQNQDKVVHDTARGVCASSGGQRRAIVVRIGGHLPREEIHPLDSPHARTALTGAVMLMDHHETRCAHPNPRNMINNSCGCAASIVLHVRFLITRETLGSSCARVAAPSSSADDPRIVNPCAFERAAHIAPRAPSYLSL